MRITKALATALAVEYHAYAEASANSDREGIKVWGQMLIETIDKTGCLTSMRAKIVKRIASSERVRALETSDNG